MELGRFKRNKILMALACAAALAVLVAIWQWKSVRKLEDVPLEGAVAIQKFGDGRRTVVIFSDPYCEFCRKLALNLDGISNATVYTIMHPLIDERSPVAALKIWCSPNRSAAWLNWMERGEAPDEIVKSCDRSGLKTGDEYATSLKLSGVPAVLTFPGGELSIGGSSASAINDRLDRGEK